MKKSVRIQKLHLRSVYKIMYLVYTITRDCFLTIHIPHCVCSLGKLITAPSYGHCEVKAVQSGVRALKLTQLGAHSKVIAPFVRHRRVPMHT